MHFSKTYQQILLTLPPELRDSAIEYRKLKKLINQVVQELTSLGLSPRVLQQVLQRNDSDNASDGHDHTDNGGHAIKARHGGYVLNVFYELEDASDHVKPHLRLRIETDDNQGPLVSSIPIPSSISTYNPALSNVQREPSLALAKDRESALFSCGSPSSMQTEHIDTSLDARGRVIPLASDTAFFALLMHTLQYLSERLTYVRSDFEASLHELSHEISVTTRPMSSSSSFYPSSQHSTNPAFVTSDLYAWREVFQLYVEAEIFESQSELSRGERTREDSEQRLVAFGRTLQNRGLAGGQRFKLKESAQAMRSFLRLLAFIQDLKKFQFATAEATRKILKKHVKRTALPLAPALSVFTSLFPNPGVSLSKLLGQAVGEQILPIIPHVDDYSCLICTSIAFKPIRLQCGHLFCVRCLVKMQKRGEDHCPLCRAPTVLSANRSNVDWALLNFMKDWFPIEAKEKLQQNEKEAAEEDMRELGIDVNGCTIM
ncbi:SPX domain-containing protein [Sparassis latifolia]